MTNDATRQTSASAGDLWAITSYYNPLSYKRRRDNYRIFRQHLGVPLLTVELAYGPEFELGEGDAEILIQRRGGDVLWEKERLLNLALDALPTECTKVAWIDCDVIFGEQDWAKRASQLLERVPLVQLFSQMHYLPADARLENRDSSAGEAQATSLASAVASGLNAETCFDIDNERGVVWYKTGLAWAAQRELLQRHRFYDVCVIGGGDRAMAAAVYGCFAHLIHYQRLNERQITHYLAWAETFHKAVCGAVGHLDGDLFHLWHGAVEHRGWGNRFMFMAPFRFDPYEDLALTTDGLWRWASDKPEMHAHVREHFARRREDG